MSGQFEGFAKKRKTEDVFTVYINECEKQQIRDWVKMKPDIQTGGDLFGLWIDAHTAVVQFVLGPGKECRRSTASFFQDVEYLQQAGDTLTKHHGLCNIGQWHSHHKLALSEPSAGDHNTVWNNMPDLDLQWHYVNMYTRYWLMWIILMLYYTHVPLKSTDRLERYMYIVFIANITRSRQVTVNCFLFEIKDGQQLPVMKGCWKEVSGESPLRLNKQLQERINIGAESLNTREEAYNDLTKSEDRKPKHRNQSCLQNEPNDRSAGQKVEKDKDKEKERQPETQPQNKRIRKKRKQQQQTQQQPPQQQQQQKQLQEQPEQQQQQQQQQPQPAQQPDQQQQTQQPQQQTQQQQQQQQQQPEQQQQTQQPQQQQQQQQKQPQERSPRQQQQKQQQQQQQQSQQQKQQPQQHQQQPQPQQPQQQQQQQQTKQQVQQQVLQQPGQQQQPKNKNKKKKKKKKKADGNQLTSTNDTTHINSRSECDNHNPATDPIRSNEIKQEPQLEATPKSHDGDATTRKLVENCTALVQETSDTHCRFDKSVETS